MGERKLFAILGGLILLLSGVLAWVVSNPGGLPSWVSPLPPPVDIATLPLGPEEALEYAMYAATAGGTHAGYVLDMRLIDFDIAIRTMGGIPNYEEPPADVAPPGWEWPEGSRDRPDDPTWVITVMADDLRHMPMVGDSQKEGIHAVYDARRNDWVHLSIFPDLSRSDYEDLQKLPNWAAGQVPPEVVARMVEKGGLPPRVGKTIITLA